MAKCWIDGTLVEEAEARISVRDTGLLHGAGAFTTMRAYGGKAFRVDGHLARLRKTCQSLFIPLQHSDEVLGNAVAEVMRANELSDARMRLTVTRGPISQDPLHGMRMEPSVFITAVGLDPYAAEYYKNGMTVLAYDLQKLNPYDMQAGHKTLDYFSRFTALRDANRRGAGEALWFNVHNYLQSGSISNVFVVKGKQLVTPPTQAELDDDAIAQQTPYSRSNVLPGITRGVVLELARSAGIPVTIRALTVDDLLSADECFLTNSIMEIMPVCRIERKPLGADKPGDLTGKIAVLYRNAITHFLGA